MKHVRGPKVADAVAGLDGAEYQLAVEEAQAAVADAQNKLREATLFDDRIPDPSVRADRQAAARVRSGVEAAEVRLRRARLDLTRIRTSSPFAGRVASLKVVPGQWVRQGDELMTVVDLDPIKVEVQVLESEIAHLTPGRTANVSFAAFPGEAFTGRVQTINPIVESGTRTARVTVLVNNPGGRILPGMYARVSLQAQRYADRVLVPRSSILERDRRSMLFVYEPGSADGLAKWRYVTTGLQNETLVEQVSERAGQLLDAQNDTIERLAQVVEFHDDATGHHTRRVGEIELGQRESEAPTFGETNHFQPHVQFAQQMSDPRQSGSSAQPPRPGTLETSAPSGFEARKLAPQPPISVQWAPPVRRGRCPACSRPRRGSSRRSRWSASSSGRCPTPPRRRRAWTCCRATPRWPCSCPRSRG